ncbi:hypothetical protein EDC96DRAFT_100336 [Choanephora cucurbitarum]|nr:hypothetical protein EDC96DRAFT_100336 [Choanephora cucurbitarum]
MTENPICKVPHLNAQWFHAIDCPILDPIAVRKAKRERSSINITSEAKKAETASKNAPKNWVPFSKRDNIALERAYQASRNLSIHE